MRDSADGDKGGETREKGGLYEEDTFCLSDSWMMRVIHVQDIILDSHAL